MAQNLHFRTATADDAATVRILIEAAFRAHDSRPDWTGDMGLASAFTMQLEFVVSAIDNPKSDILLALDDKDDIIGCVGVLHKPDLDTARISWLAVDQRQHRGGIGRRILEQAETYSRDLWRVKTFGLNALFLAPSAHFVVSSSWLSANGRNDALSQL